MKRKILFSALFVLLLPASVLLYGQYTGSNPNVAAFKAAVASDSTTGFEPGKAVDTLLTTYASIPGAAPSWIQIDLGAYHYIDGFGLDMLLTGELTGSFTFQVSEDGASWTDLGVFGIPSAGSYSFDLTAPDPVMHVRIYMSATDDPASFHEIEIYGEVILVPPKPLCKDATGVTSNAFTANWFERPTATGYRLDVAYDIGFENYVPGFLNLYTGNHLSFAVTGLDPGTSYFYRIRAYNISGVSENSNKIVVVTLPGAQSITFNSLDPVSYGDADFALTATASSGLNVSYASSNEEVATVSSGVVTLTGAGTTQITASQQGNAQYLPATPVVQDLVVGVKELSVTGAVAENKTYDGTAAAAITGGTLEGILGADVVNLSNATLGTFAQADVGTGIAVATTMALGGPDEGNYSLLQPVLSADITPRNLMATADDANREECAPNPDFSVSYSGFVDGEDASVLTEEASATCAADENALPGPYDIVPSGGNAANYTIIHQPGTLTVFPDVTAPLLAVQNITIQLDATGVAIISPADVVTNAWDNCSIADTTLSKIAFTGSDVGIITVEVVLSDMAGNTTTSNISVTVEAYVGIQDLEGSGIRFYPNPAEGQLTVESDIIRHLYVEISSLNGATLLRKELEGSSIVVDLSSFAKGIYFISFKSDQYSAVHKIVKQ